MVKLDKTECAIIKLLQEDGRMSFVEIADRVGVTEGTVRRKFHRLLETGVINIGATSDPFLIGFKTPAIIGLSVETSRMRDVAKELSKLSRVRQLVLTTGIFDIVMVAYFSSNRELAEFVTEKVATIDGITDTNTSVVLDMYKDSFEVGLPEHLDVMAKPKANSKV